MKIDPRRVAIGVGLVAVVGGLTYTAVRIARSATIIDATSHAKPNSRAEQYVRSRDERLVDAVVLHQMGFSRGNDIRDYLGVTAHYVILPDGKIYQLYPHSVRLPASDGFNARSVSIEFAGNMPSRARSNDPSHYWFPSGHYGSPVYMNHLTPAQAKSGQALLRRLHRHGIRYVFAHRQSAAQRGNDPGPEPWGAVGEYGIRKLGMSSAGPGYAIGNGQPIPQSWRDAYASMKHGVSGPSLAQGLGAVSTDHAVSEDEHGRDPGVS